MTALALARPLAGLAARIPGWLLHQPGSASARRLERLAHFGFARAFGLSIESLGEPPPPGTLIVANHISWADIPVFGALTDADFVAKSEIGRWPGIGALARRSGALFVDRAARSAIHAQAGAIARRLRSGRSVLLFAEGTTSDGSQVLPFRSSLFDAAGAARHVQPAAISYHAPGGARLTPERLREISWTGDDRLLPSAILLARQPALARVEWLEPLETARFPDRKSICAAAHQAVAAAYAAANRSR